MAVLIFILYLFGLICFLIDAFVRPSTPRISWISLGLAFFITPFVIQAGDAIF